MQRVSVIEELSTYTTDDEQQFVRVVQSGLTGPYQGAGIPKREQSFNDPDGYDEIDLRSFTGTASEALRNNKTPEEPDDSDNSAGDVV